MKDQDFQKKLLETFRVEAEEHIAAITSGLLELEKTGEAQKQKEILESIFREAHSFKGAARVVNQTEAESACQKIENLFASLQRNEIPLTRELFDTVHRIMDGLAVIPSRAPRPAASPAPRGAEEPSPPKSAETVRIPTAKLDALFLQAEELLSAKLAGRRRSLELREMTAVLSGWKKQWTRILPELRALEKSLEGNGEKKNPRARKLLEFAQWNSEFVRSLQNQAEGAEKAAQQDLRFTDSLVDGLLQEMKTILMLPCSSVLDMFPKFVRDLSQERGKDVDLVIRGGEIEIDRRILEEMKDPLIHLVRNSIDHGIEKKEERETRGKPPRGLVTLAISPKEGGNFEALISDDGAGIDVPGVRAAAVKAGFLSPEEAGRQDEPEILSFIFRSGVSTSPFVTELSGRGLGLAIVREKVEKLGGAIRLENNPGRGTAFRIVLPVTLTTARGVLVRAAENLFIIPMIHVERVMRIEPGDIKTVENRETIHYDGQPVALARLGKVLGVNSRESGSNGKIPVVLLGAGDRRIAFAVDQVENEQEFLVKSLGPQLRRVRNIAAATILGTGKMVPILHVPDLMDSAVKAAAAPAPPPPAVESRPERKSILVVEDSITSRTLLKNILEAAGYDVKTAVDGLDAFTALRSEAFHLVVSDVDMPRMNGFDLTARVRSDRRLSGIPVVLVTALESREDRERGIDVGASAYIVKSSFDQQNLLEIIKRLLG